MAGHKCVTSLNRVGAKGNGVAKKASPCPASAGSKAGPPWGSGLLVCSKQLVWWRTRGPGGHNQKKRQKEKFCAVHDAAKKAEQGLKGGVKAEEAKGNTLGRRGK